MGIRAALEPLSKLVRLPRNPKAHNLGDIHLSYGRFGFLQRIIINDATGRMIAGHGRVDALQQRKASGMEPPANIEVRGGEWLVPADHVEVPAELEEAAALALNRVGEGEWDDATLAAVLADLAAGPGLEGTGFDGEFLDELLREQALANAANVPAPEPQVDKAAELQEKWGTALGQVWEVPSATVPGGRAHRVMCGDSTKAEDVGRLMGGGQEFFLLTDPPYCSGGFQEAGKARGSKGTTTRINREIARDTLSTRGYMALIGTVFDHFRPLLAYVFTDWRMWVNLFDVVESKGYGVRGMIVWDKETPGMGIGWRHQHELVMFASQCEHKFDNHKAQGDVIRSQRTGNILHPTEKPIDLLIKIIKVTDFIGEVADPFLGSGTTIVACEQTGRVGYGMEISEGYVAVCLQRLSDMGLSPHLLE